MVTSSVAGRQTIEDIADGYYEADLEGRLVMLNRSLRRILGYTTADSDYRLDFVNTENQQRLEQAFRHVRETGSAVDTVECQIVRPDNEIRTLEFSIALTSGSRETPNGFCGIVRDITERARADYALKRRFSQLTLLQQIESELSQTLALDSVLEVALRAALRVSGAESGFIGLIEHDQIRLARSVGGYPETWLPLDVGIVARVVDTQHAEMVEDVEHDPDYHPDIPGIRAEIALPLIGHGKAIGVLNLETAVQERFKPEVFELAQLLSPWITAAIENAQLYEALQAQLAETRTQYSQVSDLEQLKTHMIRVAAHDLRGPLSIIGSYVELLDEDLAGYYGDMDAMYVNAIRQAVLRMTQMTSDILSLERLHEQRDMSLTRVQLGGLLERVIGEFAEETGKQQIHVSIVPLTVYGDTTELHEAIANLVSNAIKYTPEGGVIEACLEQDGDSALLEIRDNGFGIPKDQHEQLFQPFRRIKTRETYGIEGTGLGLYLVKKIVERHGGAIYFQSEHGKGSVFGFRLPLAKPAE